MRKPDISLSSPDITNSEREAVSRVLLRRTLSIGPEIVAFEERFSSFLGVSHAVAVNSGTSGLHLAVIAAGLSDGDLVLTTPFSYVASANAALYQRGIPVFIDVDRRTGNIDPELIRQAAHDLMRGGAAARKWLPPALRNGRRRGDTGRLKMILPVHVFGQPVDMDPILEVASEYELVVVEDACEALGSEYKQFSAGSMGHAGVFAFYPNKQMTTGEGGMIVTNRDDWAELFRSLRNQGRIDSGAWLCHARLGYNYRMDEMSAALGRAQMERIDELIASREKVAAWYNERLAGMELIETPEVVESTTRMSWFVYVVRVRPPLDRDRLIDDLANVGIPTRPYFTPIHLQPFYRERFGYETGDFPVSEELGNISLALPFSGVMTERQVDFVCSTLERAVYEFA